MAGTTGDIIPIVIVPVVVLAVWLRIMFYADSHPRWGSQAPTDPGFTQALEGEVPAQRLGGSGPVVPAQCPGPAADDATARRAPGGAAPVS
jgi:hypothetical protein